MIVIVTVTVTVTVPVIVTVTVTVSVTATMTMAVAVTVMMAMEEGGVASIPTGQSSDAHRVSCLATHAIHTEDGVCV